LGKLDGILDADVAKVVGGDRDVPTRNVPNGADILLKFFQALLRDADSVNGWRIWREGRAVSYDGSRLAVG
jgi:hypothetical protein